MASLISLLTLISNIIFVAVFFVFATHAPFRSFAMNFVYKHILSLTFLISLSAIIGSLLYSQVIGFPPCELCWIQRMFIYPQALLAFIAMRKNGKMGDKGIMDYLLPMSVVGGAVALYHSYVQWGGGFSIAPCVAEGGECAKVFVLSHGYITIPFMSFSVFAYLITLAVIYYKARTKYLGTNDGHITRA